MIIFDLDGCLANDEHRRHFVDVDHEKNKMIAFEQGDISWNDYKKKWQPDKKAYYDACDKDEPIHPSIEITQYLYGNDYYDNDADLHIWSGRCESVREKTEKWLYDNNVSFPCGVLKMRPVGDDRPQEELFEEWLSHLEMKKINEYAKELKQGKQFCFDDLKLIDMIFSSHKPTIAMFRRRGVFVFDCNQGE